MQFVRVARYRPCHRSRSAEIPRPSVSGVKRPKHGIRWRLPAFHRTSHRPSIPVFLHALRTARLPSVARTPHASFALGCQDHARTPFPAVSSAHPVSGLWIGRISNRSRVCGFVTTSRCCDVGSDVGQESPISTRRLIRGVNRRLVRKIGYCRNLSTDES